MVTDPPREDLLGKGKVTGGMLSWSKSREKVVALREGFTTRLPLY
jgi:hypothetical protein